MNAPTNRFATGIFLLFSIMAPKSGAEPASIGFNRDIRPILSDKCFHCHGPDANTREADLRLDTREDALASDAIIPGDLNKSELIQRIISSAPDQRMPPPEGHKSLTKEEIAALRQWVAEGAQYEGQWIYEVPERPDLPDIPGATTPNPIDRFIQARLAKENRSPAPAADRMRLIRRLSFDLTGLPPTPAEVDAFTRDKSPDAHARLVDRLLDSPAHGERMAAWWLDLVRYADTVGFHGDQNVSQSPYRDYVIEAFNSNMPFDRFTREQLAGDLLPNASLEQTVASGYNRLNMTTEEGGAQPKEYLAKYAGDRVRNTSVVWLGATLGCAECHDHKFDPFTMRDFYSFAAFFSDLEEVGKYSARKRPPEISVPSPDQQKALEDIESELADLRKTYESDTPEIIAAREQWIAANQAELTREDMDAPASDHYLIEDKVAKNDRLESTWNYVGKGEHPVYRGEHSRLQQNEALTQHILRFEKPRIMGSEGKFFTFVHLDPENLPETVMLQVLSGGKWEHRAYWGKDKIVYGGIGKDGPAHHRMGTLPPAGEWIRLEVSASDIAIAPGDHIEGLAFTQFGGRAWWDDSGIHGRLRHVDLPKPIVTILGSTAPSDAEIAQLSAHFRSITPLLEETRQRIKAKETEHQKLLSTIPTMPISRAVEPRTMRILPRGNWMDESGEIVEPAIPGFLGQLEPSGGADRLNRLDLAKWITSRDNPMTARTLVNRLWYLFFGTGISNVLSDLGNQGEPPVHPELLDWLAVEFMDSGWDLQHIIRLIVRSHTYRQSSMPAPDLREFDPYNRLLSVQSRRRLSAEMVRDNALKISGLLTETIGGPSVHPYQPSGYYAQLNFPRRTYQPSTDDNQYRRALYSHWQRTFLHPALMAFDAPAREACTAERPVSNTPLQALVLMNDPSYVEAARFFAQRIMTEGGETPEARIRWAAREALSRAPHKKEAAVLLRIYQKHLMEYRMAPEEARSLLEVGLKPVETENPAELAAWTSVTRVILNLHELITRL